jgi:hypothetical protein
MSKYMLNDLPLCSGLHTSLKTAPPSAYILLAPNPARNLAAINVSFVFANPHTIFHNKNHTLLACSTLLRPYTSLKGPIISGPNAVASR